jgi:hypothetical protein
MSPTVSMSPAVTTPGPSLAQDHALGAFALPCGCDFLDVQDDVGDVFTHARDGRELVQTPSIWTRSRQRPAARTAARGAGRCPASGHSHAPAARRQLRLDAGVVTRLDLELGRLDQFLPVFRWSRFRPFGYPARPKKPGGGAIWRNKVWGRQSLRRGGACGGRQPLCGIGVTSRIDVIWKAAACSARSAIHGRNPDRGPRLRGSSCRAPCLLGGIFSRDLRGIRGRLARALEAHVHRRTTRRSRCPEHR